jgi:curli biogenesis system outer membrane secretion channel CsgG
MKRFVFSLAVAIAMVISVLPAQAATGKVRVAVMNFANNSTWTYWGDKLGEAANDEFTTQLQQSGKFTVIERAQLQSILSEQSLGASGAVSPSTAPKIGKLLGVQLIFTGSISAFSIKGGSGGAFGINVSSTRAKSTLDVRLIDTTTGEVILTATGSGDKKVGGVGIKGVNFENHYDEGIASEALRPAIQQVTQNVLAQFDRIASLAPAAGSGKVLDVKSPTQIYIDGGQDGGLNVGDTFAVYRVTEEIKDDDGNVLDKVEEKVGKIVVTKVLSKSAIAESQSGTIKKGDSYRKE